MSEPSTSSTTLTQKSNQTDEGQSQGPSGHQEGGQGGREGQEGGQKGGQEGPQLRCRHSRAVEDLQQEVQRTQAVASEEFGCEQASIAKFAGADSGWDELRAEAIRLSLSPGVVVSSIDRRALPIYEAT